MEFKEIEEKHKVLIDIAKCQMNTILDREHDIHHMNDVVYYMKRILESVDVEVNTEVCIIGAYWHDVGRTQVSNGHEHLSAKLLEEEMKKLNYDNNFIYMCSKAIEFHKWNMIPQTLEGWMVKDADKLAWLGSGRWSSCIENKQRLDELLTLLPDLRNKILHFECSKKIYDIEIIKILKLLYEKIYN